MNDSVDILIKETAADIKRHEGLAAEHQDMASRERSLLDALINVYTELKIKTDNCEQVQQENIILKQQVDKLTSRPLKIVFGDDVEKKYSYNQEARPTTK